MFLSSLLFCFPVLMLGDLGLCKSFHVIYRNLLRQDGIATATRLLLAGTGLGSDSAGVMIVGFGSSLRSLLRPSNLTDFGCFCGTSRIEALYFPPSRFSFLVLFALL